MDDEDDDLDEELLIYESPQFIFIPNPPNPISTFFIFSIFVVFVGAFHFSNN
jgi:hypothetical protein